MSTLAAAPLALAGGLSPLLEHMSDAFLALDREWRVLYVNAAAERYVGCRREAVLGSRVWDALPHLRETPLCAELERAAREDVAVSFETSLPPAQRRLAVRAYPFPEARGLAVYFQHLPQPDARHEMRLRRERERLHIALAASATGTFCWDPHTGDFVDFDDGLKRLFGFAPGEPVCSMDDVIARVHPDEVPDLIRAIDRCREGADFDMEYRVVLPDGSVRWLANRGKMEHDAAGRTTHLVAACTDITSRKQVEDAMRESEAKVAAELADMQRLQHISSQLTQQEGSLEDLYEQILEAAIAVMRSDMGSLQMLDPEENALRLLAWRGFHPASAAHWEWVHLDSGSTCGLAFASSARVVVEDVERCDDLAGTQHLDHYRLSGILAIQSTPLVSRDGRVVGMMSTHWRAPRQPTERELRLFDVLARQAADLIERKRADEALRAANRRMDEFLHTATHELKSPLTALQANLQLVERRLQRLLTTPSDTPRAASEALQTPVQIVSRSQQQVRRLTRLVDDLVDAARIQAGKLEIRPAPCDLAEIVWEAVTEQRAVQPERVIHLHLGQL